MLNPTRAAAVACYVVALAGAAALAALVLLLGLDLSPPIAALPHPWMVNLGWLVLFGIQHTGMARAGFKRFWTRIVPPTLERSLYAALAGLVLIGLGLTWQKLDGGPLWRLPRGLVVLSLTAAAGLAYVNLRFDHLGLFGVRQAWQQDVPELLLVVGPYRYVRHPLMACLVGFLWLQPVMPPGLALLGAGLSAYIALGLWFEERDLRRRFGAAYDAYRRRVPALLPWRPPVSPAVYPAVRPE